METAAFSPYFGQTQSIAATTTSASVTLSGTGVQSKGMLIANSGTVPIHYRCGEGAQTATTADPVVLGGESRVFLKQDGHNTVAIRTNTGTATVFVCPGDYGVV